MQFEDQVAAVEADKYHRIWLRQDYRQHSPGERDFQGGLRVLKGRGLEPMDSLVDLGCGTGRAASLFNAEGLAVTGVDIAPNCLDGGPAGRIQFVQACLWDLPGGLGPFDWGYCTDVMEHIPPTRIAATLSEISRVISRSVYFQINKHESHGRHGDAIGVGSLHLSVYPAAVWRVHLEQHFDDVELVSDNPRDCCFIAAGRAGVR